jgi:uncharacterized DUF497 family protein
MTRRETIHWGRFIWDAEKERANVARHGVDFRTAAGAFLDPYREILLDEKHSDIEFRRHCIGMTLDGVITVRYTHRGEQIRIIGAGYWRKGRKRYEKKNSIR